MSTAEQWRDIATAPKDGTEILIIATRHSMIVPKNKFFVGRWSRGWWTDDAPLSHVKYWMPLPPPPGATPPPDPTVTTIGPLCLNHKGYSGPSADCPHCPKPTEAEVVGVPREIAVNINEYAKVKLTAYGRTLHRENHGRFWLAARHLSPPAYSPPEEDADGWSKWQLWDLMAEFGPHIRLGTVPPFETEIYMRALLQREG